LFDYDAFERRFRGEPDELRTRFVERYETVLDGRSPIVDIGCGRGELLEILRDRGADVVGVEPNPDMARQARDRGLTVVEQYAGEYLRSIEDQSLGAILAFQVVEHLSFDDLLELISLAAVMHTSFILDPTHTWPLHPALLAFLCERAGFDNVRVEYFGPAVEHHLSLVKDDDAPEWIDQINAAFSQLNERLYGPQDYTVVAQIAETPAGTDSAS
jgi:SAM-dependent methyltransferase